MKVVKPFILVVGGAGYIGSHMVKLLQSSGYTPVVLDNLSTGNRASVKDAIFIETSMSDGAVIERVFVRYPFEAVMHFAGHIQVGESTQDPLKYYDNNVASTIKLLKTLNRLRVKNFVFSSSAAVYGQPQHNIPIKEDHLTNPLNAYGQTKLMIEQVLKDCSTAYGIHYAALRYFNVAGIDDSLSLHSSKAPVTHLIPLVMRAASGRNPSITIYGDDYDTADGTCVRDYIHVKDLCQAHLLALEALMSNKESFTYNLGTGKGYSVQEVIRMSQAITGKNLQAVQGERRPGDPAFLVADATLAQCKLNWIPKYSDLKTIINDAWASEVKTSNTLEAELA